MGKKPDQRKHAVKHLRHRWWTWLFGWRIPLEQMAIEDRSGLSVSMQISLESDSGPPCECHSHWKDQTWSNGTNWSFNWYWETLGTSLAKNTETHHHQSIISFGEGLRRMYQVTQKKKGGIVLRRTLARKRIQG